MFNRDEVAKYIYQTSPYYKRLQNNESTRYWRITGILNDIAEYFKVTKEEMYKFLKQYPDYFHCQYYHWGEQWTAAITLTEMLYEKFTGKKFVSYFDEHTF